MLIAPVAALASSPGSADVQSMFKAIELRDFRLHAGLRRMLGQGMSPNARDEANDGDTLLMAASYQSDPPLVQLLLEHGADVSLTDNTGGTALMSACLGLQRSLPAAACRLASIA